MKTLEELETEFGAKRKELAEDRNDRLAWPNNEARKQAIVETVKCWVRTDLVPLMKRREGNELQGESPSWESRFNAMGKLIGVYDCHRRSPVNRKTVRCTLGGAGVCLFSFSEDKVEAACRLADLFHYHFRHYRKTGADLGQSLNSTLDDVRADYEQNRDLVRIFYGLEGLLLASFAIVPHQHRKVRRLCKQDRGRQAELGEAIERQQSELVSVKMRVVDLTLCLNTLTSTFKDRLARLESGAEVFAAHILEGK
jgi:hypothetical protein